MNGGPHTPASRRPLVLACGVDDRFAMPLAVTLHSALSCLRGGYDVFIYVIDGGLGAESVRRLRRVLRHTTHAVHLEFVTVDVAKLGDAKVGGHLPPAALFRLLIPEVVPGCFEKAIYLDSDLLVQADLGTLWEMEIGDMALLAARDYAAPSLSSRAGLRNYRELGLDPDAPYLNSGVLVVNLARWRAGGIGRAILRHTIESREFIQFADQDGFNAILVGDWGILDPKWNVPAYIASDVAFEGIEDSPFKEELRARRWELIREARILHFLGPRKPWSPGCGLPGQWAWLRTLERCGWFEAGELAPRLKPWGLRADWLFRKALRRIRGARRPQTHPKTAR